MNTEVPIKEGFVSFRGHNVWYRIVGDHEESGKYPLLCLHGGPGAPHDYFEPLEAIARNGRRVIFYDQLGCGNSDVPTDESIYSMALYLEEVGAVRQALGLKYAHLLGHSWGGHAGNGIRIDAASGLGKFDSRGYRCKYSSVGIRDEALSSRTTA